MEKENRFSRQLNPPPVETEPLKSISTTGKVSFTSIKKNRSQTVDKPVPSIKYHQENVTRSDFIMNPEPGVHLFSSLLKLIPMQSCRAVGTEVK